MQKFSRAGTGAGGTQGSGGECGPWGAGEEGGGDLVRHPHWSDRRAQCRKVLPQGQCSELGFQRGLDRAPDVSSIKPSAFLQVEGKGEQPTLSPRLRTCKMRPMIVPPTPTLHRGSYAIIYVNNVALASGNTQ